MTDVLFRWEDYLSSALTNKVLLVQFLNVLKGKMFESTLLGNIYLLLTQSFTEHKRCPTEDELILCLKHLPEAEKKRLDKYVDKIYHLFHRPRNLSADVIAQETQEAIQRFLVGEFLQKSASQYETNQLDYTALFNDFKTIRNLTLDVDMGTEIGSNVDRVMEQVAKGEYFESISTGIGKLDEVLHGGFYKKQLAICLAPSNRGKSAFLVNHAVGAAADGKNVLLLTCEMTDIGIIDRVVRRILRMTREEMLDNLDRVTHKLKSFFHMYGSRFIVKYVKPNSFTVNDLEAYLERLDYMIGFVPDEIVIDYLDELYPSKTEARMELRHRHRGIARDLFALTKSADVAIVTATQTNKQALEKHKITEKYMGEDYGKFKIADLVYVINQDADEEKAGVARIGIIKVRNLPGRGREVLVRTNFEIMLVEAMQPKTGVSEEDLEPIKEEEVSATTQSDKTN